MTFWFFMAQNFIPGCVNEKPTSGEGQEHPLTITPVTCVDSREKLMEMNCDNMNRMLTVF
jgi:hypothetical protein